MSQAETIDIYPLKIHQFFQRSVDKYDVRKLLFLLGCAMFVFSCERANNSNTTQISLTTPASTADLAYVENLTNSLNVNLLNASTSNDQYLDIVPNGYDTNSSSDAVNCYLVTVTGPEQDMNVNNCGLTNDAGDGFTPLHSFGPYSGLIKSNSTIFLDVPSGKDRQVKMFGFNAKNLDECKDINFSPQKNTMSYPYLVGTSQKVNLEGGKVGLEVDLQNPTINDRVDGCNIEVPNSLENEPGVITYNDSVFPFNSLIIPPTGFYCQQIDFNFFNNLTESKLSAFYLPYDFVLEAGDGTSFTTLTTYDAYLYCHSAKEPKTVISVKATKPGVARWIRIGASDTWITQLRARNINRTDVASDIKQVNLVNDPTNTYSTDLMGMPNYLVNGICYPFKVGIRSFYGEFPTSIGPTSVSIIPKISSTAVGQIYNDSNCSSVVTSIPFTTNQSLSSQFYVKLNLSTATTDQGYFYVTKNYGDSSVSVYNMPFKVEMNGTSIPSLSLISSNGFTYINYIQLNGSNRCVPLTFYFKDQNELPYVANSTDSFVLSAVPDRNIDSAELYTDSSCTSPLSGTQMIGVGNHSTTIYIKGISPPVTTQRKDLRITVNSSVVSDVLFYLRTK